MNFTNFQLQRSRFLNERPGLLDAAETNAYRALSGLMPKVKPVVSGQIHRCHLAGQWVDFYGLPPDASRRALVSCGVRDSLRIFFQSLAARTSVLWLPEDNYPVYFELAIAAGLAFRSFPTLPEIEWPEDAPTGVASEWLLITNPLKPRGRLLDAADIAHLKQWLAASPKRRVVLDTVYTLDTRFDAVTLDLLATEQVILLHSLTKGWLHPRCFGIVLLPEQDAAGWMPVFRMQPPPQENLATARHLMAIHADSPARIAQCLTAAQEKMLESIRHLQVETLSVDSTSYLVPVRRRWEELLAQDVLGLPASVFGSHRGDLSLLSTLNFAQ